MMAVAAMMRMTMTASSLACLMLTTRCAPSPKAVNGTLSGQSAIWSCTSSDGPALLDQQGFLGYPSVGTGGPLQWEQELRGLTATSSPLQISGLYLKRLCIMGRQCLRCACECQQSRAMKYRHIFRNFNFWGTLKRGPPVRLRLGRCHGLPHCEHQHRLHKRGLAHAFPRSPCAASVERRDLLRHPFIRNHGRGDPRCPRPPLYCYIRLEVN